MSSPSFPDSLQERYAPLGLLGAGGMGAVFLARDRTLRRKVAVKTMLDLSSQEERRRFLREAKALAAVRHPNIVQVYDHGETPEGPYLVMEHLEGKPLTREAPPGGLLEFMLPIADALQHLHEQGLLHRDVKPGNLFRTEDGRPVLMDLGLVLDSARTKLTRTGAVLGTLAYMSPETLRGAEASPATDWWAYGVTLFALAEGSMPFTREQLIASAQSELALAPVYDRTRPGSPVWRVIQGCLAPDPAQRPGSAARIRELAGEGGAASAAHTAPPDLETEVSATPVVETAPEHRPAPSRAPWIAAALGVGLLVLLPFTGTREEAPPPPPTRAAPDFLDRLVEQASRLEDDPDPPDPVRVRAALPSLGQVDAWLAGPARPESWTPERIEDLRRADRALRGAGLPRRFEFLIGAAPLGKPVVRPRSEGDWDVDRFRHPETVSGWYGAAWVARAEAFRLLREREAVLRRALAGDRSAQVPIQVPRVALATTFDSRSIFETALVRPEERRRLFGWMRPVAEATRRLFYLMARSLREEPELRERVPFLLFDSPSWSLRLAWYSSLAAASIEEQFPGAPDHPAADLVRGHVLARVARVVERSQRSGDEIRILQKRYLRRALRDPGESFHGRMRFMRALSLLLDRLGPPQQRRELIDEHEDALWSFPDDEQRGKILATLARDWRPSDPPDRRMLDRVQAWAATIRGDEKRRRCLQSGLRKALAGLGEPVPEVLPRR